MSRATVTKPPIQAQCLIHYHLLETETMWTYRINAPPQSNEKVPMNIHISDRDTTCYGGRSRLIFQKKTTTTLFAGVTVYIRFMGVSVYQCIAEQSKPFDYANTQTHTHKREHLCYTHRYRIVWHRIHLNTCTQFRTYSLI